MDAGELIHSGILANTNEQPLAGLMKRTWLDNALIVESTKLLTLAEQIIHSDLDVEACSSDLHLEKIIRLEWESKGERLDQLLEVLQSVCRQVHEEIKLMSVNTCE